MGEEVKKVEGGAGPDERHEMVIHALLWVVSVVTGTAIAGAVSACVVLVRLMAKA